MRGLEPKIKEQIGYHAEGDLEKAMVMAKKADLWRFGGKRGSKRTKKTKNLGAQDLKARCKTKFVLQAGLGHAWEGKAVGKLGAGPHYPYSVATGIWNYAV